MSYLFENELFEKTGKDPEVFDRINRGIAGSPLRALDGFGFGAPSSVTLSKQDVIQMDVNSKRAVRPPTQEEIDTAKAEYYARKGK